MFVSEAALNSFHDDPNGIKPLRENAVTAASESAESVVRIVQKDHIPEAPSFFAYITGSKRARRIMLSFVLVIIIIIVILITFTILEGKGGNATTNNSLRSSNDDDGAPMGSESTSEITTNEPTYGPTYEPTDNELQPTTVILKPTEKPNGETKKPEAHPTHEPTFSLITSQPTISPITYKPTLNPTGSSTTLVPSVSKDFATSQPTTSPTTDKPTLNQTELPTTLSPSSTPTTQELSASPSETPVGVPTASPSTTLAPTKIIPSIVFNSGVNIDNNETSEYFTKLRPDGNLVTRAGSPNQKGEVVWSSDSASDEKDDYFLALNEDGKSVSIYRGKIKDGRVERVWTDPVWTTSSSSIGPYYSEQVSDDGRDELVIIPLLISSEHISSEKNEIFFPSLDVGIFQQKNGNLIIYKGSSFVL